jgi:TonB-linked SusC/RagA family outer membrane protein
MNFLQRSKSYGALLCFILFACTHALAQTKTVSGLVKSAADNNPFAGVSVQLKGGNAGTYTDENGKFTLSEVPQNATLVFTATGFLRQEVPVAGKTSIDITLQTDATGLNEVIVTGYRSQTRGSVTGSVTSVSGNDLKDASYDNLSNALAGRLTGVTIIQSAGTPGMESSIKVRAQGTFNNSDPLYVIDGVVSDKFAFDGLSPNEVESISVLKDGASAAIYGSRAANGVILVTTRRGKQGTPVLNYNGVFGIQSPTKIPETLNAYEHASQINHQLNFIKANPGDARYYTVDELEYFRQHSWDWVDEMWKDPYTTQHSLDVSGGNQHVRYFLGGSYNFATGSFNNLDFRKYTLRGNVDVNVSKNLKLSLDMNTDTRGTRGPSWQIGNWRQEDLYKALLFRSAMVPPYVNGLPVGNWVEWHPGVVVTPSLSGYNNMDWTGLNAIVTLNYSIPFVKGLSVKTSFNKYQRTTYRKQFNLPYNMTVFNTTGDNNHIVGDQPVSIRPRAADEFLLSRSDKLDRYQYNLQLNYKRSFGRHNLDALLVYEQAEGDNVWFSGRKDDFISSAIDQYLAGSIVRDVDGEQTQTARISYVGLASYNFDERYMLDASFRYDGSVIFAPGKRWGFFPSVSAGWRISNEKFFQPVQFINDFKLRASVGLLGNDAVGQFQWLQSYNIGYGAIFGSQTLGLTPGVLANKNITWEKSLNYNAGLDAGFWDNRMSFKLDVFYRHSYDILGDRELSLPSTLGADLPDENYQQVNAHGFEVELGYNSPSKGSGGKISYYARANFGYATSKIVQVDEPENLPAYWSEVGRPVGLQGNGNINSAASYTADMLFGYVATGVIRTQADLDALPAGYTILGVPAQLGMINYQDIRGPNSDKPDGKITAEDREFLGKYSIPPANYGLSLGLTWKSLSIDILFQGLAGAKAMLPTAGRDIQARAEESSFRYWADSWSPENPNGKYPGYRVTNYRTRFDASSFFLVDNSFLRLKNLNVSWSLPQSMVDKVKIKKARLFFTGTNLVMLWSKNEIYDPEMNSITAYPMMRGYSLGLNVGL